MYLWFIACSIWSAGYFTQSCLVVTKNMHTIHGVFVVTLSCFSIKACAAGMV